MLSILAMSLTHKGYVKPQEIWKFVKKKGAHKWMGATKGWPVTACFQLIKSS